MTAPRLIAFSHQRRLFALAGIDCLDKKGSLLNSEKTIGIGIVGAGFARTTQIPGFKNCSGARILSIASGQRENAEKVATEFGIEHVANDWQELIRRDDVDLVSVV